VCGTPQCIGGDRLKQGFLSQNRLTLLADKLDPTESGIAAGKVGVEQIRTSQRFSCPSARSMTGRE